MFLDKTPTELLDLFCEDYNNIKHVSAEDKEDIKKYIRFAKTRKEDDKSVDILKDELTTWYNSIDKNDKEPAYEIYGSDNYYKEVIACYVQYSRDYLKRIYKTNMIDSDKTIYDYIRSNISNDEIVVDLGNGIGYSTIVLSELFQNVYGTNMKDTEQWNFNKLLEKDYNFKIVEDVLKIGKVDVIFASEYFEHIQEPFEHLEDIILNNKPKFLILANSFNKRAIGHFHKYYYKNQIIDESKAQRRFMEMCKANNYKQISAKLWNNTPIILEYVENIKKESRNLF